MRDIMSKKKCSKGKACGSSCVKRSSYCRVSLSASVSGEVDKMRQVINQLFGVNLPSVKGKNDLVLDDVSRLLKGESPKHMKVSEREPPGSIKGKVIGLEKALNLGPLTRDEIGGDLKELERIAREKKKDLWGDVVKNAAIGTPKALAKEKELRQQVEDINQALNINLPGIVKKEESWQLREAKSQATAFDEGFTSNRSVSGKSDHYDWNGNSEKATTGVRGGFGSVLLTDKVAIKRGEIGSKEAEIIRKAGRAGIGPNLIYAELGKRTDTFESIDLYRGRLAMERVKGTEIDFFRYPDKKIGNGNETAGDAYWKARAKLHRAGIAHNDAHGRNVIVDLKGKAKFVDFGLAQDSPRAALSEAFGGIVNRSIIPMGAIVQGGMRTDSQARKSNIHGLDEEPSLQPTVLKKIYSNVPKAVGHMKELGMSKDEIAQIMSSGIRNSESFYNKGAWGKLTNEEATKVIGILYDGI